MGMSKGSEEGTCIHGGGGGGSHGFYFTQTSEKGVGNFACFPPGALSYTRDRLSPGPHTLCAHPLPLVLWIKLVLEAVAVPQSPTTGPLDRCQSLGQKEK